MLIVCANNGVPNTPLFTNECGKIAYHSREQANTELMFISHRRDVEGYRGKREKKVYECPRCGMFHVTSRG